MSPVCKTRRPKIVKIGKTRSNVARSQPAKIEMFPVSARWHPPETGHSTAAPPLVMTSLARRAISTASVVDISIQVLPSATSGSISVTTASQAAGDGKQVTTTSQSRINCAALVPATAPFSTKALTKSAFRSKTCNAFPFRNKLPANFPPTLPSPINPTRIMLSSVSTKL